MIIIAILVRTCGFIIVYSRKKDGSVDRFTGLEINQVRDGSDMEQSLTLVNCVINFCVKISAFIR